MESFAKSWFWRCIAAALVVAIYALAAAIVAGGSGGAVGAGGARGLLVAEASGVATGGPGGVVFTTSQDGQTLYAWPVGAGGQTVTSFIERWSADGLVVRIPVRRVETPAAPLSPPSGRGGDAPGGRYGESPR